MPAAITLEGCWRLVETAERTARHCVMMENCNYGRSEMMVLNMVRQGLLGEILHGEAAYIHDLRSIKFSDANEGLWRLQHSVERNANLYPTHGLGPVAQCMDINRGDCFDYLVSLSSPARGLAKYAAERFGADDPRATTRYCPGRHELQPDPAPGAGAASCSSTTRRRRRPYSRLNLVQGTQGRLRGVPGPDLHRGRVGGARRLERRRSPTGSASSIRCGRNAPATPRGAGHGGMD